MTKVIYWSYTWKIRIFEVILVVFRLMENALFNKIKGFVGRNSSDHAGQIFSPKSTWNYVTLIVFSSR